ncbi:uncharacterized protein LOC120297791 isoform X2 [Crotalus tigris]|uniref:uncharacterized protein LOC120297791 isoform X2 n=1 Tax=Crotalus tigris TaxID=88082 RepID=UPI00192F717F|nr:uncharacterized protein LOC120297791 isoform X2 [Crotalus tigris]
MIDHLEWQLEPALFREISERFRQTQIDLFASPANAQLPRHFTRFPSRGGGGNGRSTQQMAQGTSVCIPSTSSDSSRHQEASIRTGRINLAGPTLAKASLVCRSCGPIGLPALEDSIRLHFPQSGSAPTPGHIVASTSRLILERESLARQSYSSGVIAVIQASRHPSTSRIYDATWKNFCTWYSTKKVNPLAITIPILLDYLSEGLNKGLSYNTIRRQITALSTVLICEKQVQISHHPAVTAFLKGAVNTGPPVVHRYSTWDLPKVLKVLTGSPFEPIKSCSLHLLSWKVAFLITITSARHISELAALSVRGDLCNFQDDRVILKLDPSFIPKVNTWFHRSQDLVLLDFCP